MVNKIKLTKAERKAIRRFNRGTHNLVMCTVFYPDRTYITRQFDLNTGNRTINIGGFTYNLPEFPYRTVGWWPFKPRNLKAWILPDKHYAVDWFADDPNPISIISAHANADESSVRIAPSTFSGFLRESMYGNMLASLKKKNIVSMDTKKMIIILAIIGVIAVVALSYLGVI